MKQTRACTRGLLVLMWAAAANAHAQGAPAPSSEAPATPPTVGPAPADPTAPAGTEANPGTPANAPSQAPGSVAPSPGAAAPTSVGGAAAAGSDDALSQLAWLRGCWQGKVNQREFREMWLAPLGGVMLGASHTVLQGKTSDFEFMRIEQRPDGSIVYGLAVPEQKQTEFKLATPAGEEFAFGNPAVEFPSKIVYRPGTEGWLYARVEGKVRGESKQVIYPMRHVDCMTGENVLK
jgi:hypothetical protein